MKQFIRSGAANVAAMDPPFASGISGEHELFRTAGINELVRLAHEGQRIALDMLFGRYRDRLLDLAHRRIGARLRMREDPEDLTQTTFREAARDFGRFEYRGENSFLNWLTQILRNKIRDKAEFHAAAKRDVSRDRASDVPNEDRDFHPLQDAVSEAMSATQLAEQSEEFEILHEHLNELPALPRTAIQLVYFEGLSLRDAGERMGGRSEDAVRMIVRRAAQRLRSKLEKERDRG